MVNYANKGISFTVWRAGDGANRRLREFLNEDDVKERVYF